VYICLLNIYIIRYTFIACFFSLSIFSFSFAFFLLPSRTLPFSYAPLYCLFPHFFSYYYSKCVSSSFFLHVFFSANFKIAQTVATFSIWSWNLAQSSPRRKESFLISKLSSHKGQFYFSFRNIFFSPVYSSILLCVSSFTSNSLFSLRMLNVSL
jgi:hypothetical protein